MNTNESIDTRHLRRVPRVRGLLAGALVGVGLAFGSTACIEPMGPVIMEEEPDPNPDLDDPIDDEDFRIGG